MNNMIDGLRQDFAEFGNWLIRLAEADQATAGMLTASIGLITATVGSGTIFYVNRKSNIRTAASFSYLYATKILIFLMGIRSAYEKYVFDLNEIIDNNIERLLQLPNEKLGTEIEALLKDAAENFELEIKDRTGLLPRTEEIPNSAYSGFGEHKKLRWRFFQILNGGETIRAEMAVAREDLSGIVKRQIEQRKTGNAKNGLEEIKNITRSIDTMENYALEVVRISGFRLNFWCRRALWWLLTVDQYIAWPVYRSLTQGNKFNLEIQDGKSSLVRRRFFFWDNYLDLELLVRSQRSSQRYSSPKSEISYRALYEKLIIHKMDTSNNPYFWRRVGRLTELASLFVAPIAIAFVVCDFGVGASELQGADHAVACLFRS